MVMDLSFKKPVLLTTVAPSCNLSNYPGQSSLSN